MNEQSQPHFCCNVKPHIYSDRKDSKLFYGIYCYVCGKAEEPFNSREEAVTAWNASFEKEEPNGA